MKAARISPLRYCWYIVGRSPVFMALYAAAIIYGCTSEWLSAGSSDAALAMIIVGQMLSSSTGFVSQASRGYFDPLLVAGHSRLSVGLSLFVVSALPGWVAWVCVGLAEVALQRTLDVPAFRPAGLVALLLVSCVPWSATLRSPRLTGGLVWLGLGILGVLTEKVFGLLAMAQMSPAEIRGNLWGAFLNGLALPTVMPFVKWPVEILILFTLVSLLTLAAGLAYIRFRQIPLSQEF